MGYPHRKFLWVVLASGMVFVRVMLACMRWHRCWQQVWGWVPWAGQPPAVF
jgi:hypothetical protein